MTDSTYCDDKHVRTNTVVDSTNGDTLVANGDVVSPQLPRSVRSDVRNLVGMLEVGVHKQLLVPCQSFMVQVYDGSAPVIVVPDETIFEAANSMNNNVQ